MLWTQIQKWFMDGDVMDERKKKTMEVFSILIWWSTNRWFYVGKLTVKYVDYSIKVCKNNIIFVLFFSRLIWIVDA